MNSPIDAARTVEAMQSLFGVVELAQLGEAVEPLVQLEALPEVQVEAVSEQEPTDGGRAAVADDVLAPPGERGVEQAQHVELVGDKPGIGKEALGEALVDVAHIERDEAHVLATGNIRERLLELGDGAPVDDFHQSLASKVDDHRDEVAGSKPLVSPKEVLVEPDDVRPWVQPLALLELQMPVKRAVEKASRTSEVSSYLLQVAVNLACAKQRSPIALGVPCAFANASNWLGEGSLTGFAP